MCQNVGAKITVYSDAELSVTYTWSRARLPLTIQLTNLTNPYLTILTTISYLGLSKDC